MEITMKSIISIVTNTKGFLTKQFSINPITNQLVKQSHAALSEGTVKSFEIKFEELPHKINSLKTNQALILGRLPILGKEYKLVTQQTYSQLSDNEKTNTVTRTKECFKFPEKNPIVMLDVDIQKNGMSNVEIVNHLDNIFNLMKNLECVYSPSVSSRIYNKKELLNDSDSFHLYFQITKSKDIPKLKQKLFDYTWLNDCGYIRVSKSGTQLVRSYLYDESVFSPERLVFEAPAICIPPLQQNKEPAQYQKNSSKPVFIKHKDLTDDENLNLTQAINNAKALNLPEANQIKEAYIDTQVKKLQASNPNLSLLAAQRHIRQRTLGKLYGDEVLIFDELGEVTVREVFANPAKYHEKTLKDPLDPDEINKAQIYTDNAPNIHIHSFAHGETNYKCYESKAGMTLEEARTVIVNSPLSYDAKEAQEIINKEKEKTKLVEILYKSKGRNNDTLVAIGKASASHPKSRMYLADGILARIPDISPLKAEPLNRHSCKIEMSTFCCFYKTKKDKKVFINTPQNLPSEYLSSPSGFERKISNLIDHPYIDKNKNLINEDGYDSANQILSKFKPININPYLTMENKEELLADISLGGVSFADKTAEACALGAILTTLGRKLIDIAPAFLITAPVMGAGKTTLAKMIGTIPTGVEPPTVETRSEREINKQLISSLIKKPSVILIDNLPEEKTFRSSVLSVLISSAKHSSRVLGKTKEITVSSKTTFLLTGNNTILSPELNERMVEIRLDASRGECSLDPIEWVLENRDSIIKAALSILLITKNEVPNVNLKHTRFKQWDKYVRFPIYLATGIDIADRLKNNLVVSNQNSVIEDFLKAWHDNYPTPVTATDFLSKCELPGRTNQLTPIGVLLSEIFPQNKLNKGRLVPSRIALGSWLSNLRGRFYNKYKLKVYNLEKKNRRPATFQVIKQGEDNDTSKG